MVRNMASRVDRTLNISEILTFDLQGDIKRSESVIFCKNNDWNSSRGPKYFKKNCLILFSKYIHFLKK